MADRVNLVPSGGLEFVFDPPGIRIAHLPESSLLGRIQGAGSGEVGRIVIGSGLTLTGNVLTASGGGGGGGGVTAYDLRKQALYGS